MERSIGMEWKGYESIGCWTHYVTSSYNLDRVLSRSKFENVNIPVMGWSNWQAAEAMSW